MADKPGWFEAFGPSRYDGNPTPFVISANIHRRHLTAEQKRDLIAKLVKAQPEKSNNAISKQAKVDDKTVAKVRREMEARSEIPNVETTTDTKGRKQPAKKKRGKAAATAEMMAGVKEITHDVECRKLETARDDIAEKLRAAQLKMVGLESEVEELKAKIGELGKPKVATEGDLACAFCDKSQHVVRTLVKGRHQTCICNECVALCVDIVREHETKRSAAPPTRRRGRPPGSKNKPANPLAEAAPVDRPVSVENGQPQATPSAPDAANSFQAEGRS